MDLTAGKARVALNRDTVATLRATGTLIEDPRRERPRYFDGRFLAARDLFVPEVRDVEVWLGFELHGAAAEAADNGTLEQFHSEYGAEPRVRWKGLPRPWIAGIVIDDAADEGIWYFDEFNPQGGVLWFWWVVEALLLPLIQLGGKI